MTQWYEKHLTVREDKVVLKRFVDGTFLGSIIIPTVMYPLNGKPEVFRFDSAAIVADKSVLDIIDGIPYQIGRCYTNAEAVTSALRNAGYDARTYVGWFFSTAGRTPIHHCWTVLNGKSVIDLADDFSVMLCDGNREKFQQAASVEERRALMISFQRWAGQYPNSKRCMPVGTPTAFTFYVGCPCSGKDGISIYNNLVRLFPDHPSHPKGGINPTQEAMIKSGLMDWAKETKKGAR